MLETYKAMVNELLDYAHSKVMKVAESQNGKMMPFSYENLNFFIPEKRITVAIVLDFGRG